MKIEEGKFYKSRSGAKVGPLKLGINRRKWPGDFWVVEGIWGPTWWEDGVVHREGGSNDYDLVSEWPSEGPVRDVTRKEIVTGVYGVVSVIGIPKHISSCAEINLTCAALSSSELRAAAATFLAIAEALESNK